MKSTFRASARLEKRDIPLIEFLDINAACRLDFRSIRLVSKRKYNSPRRKWNSPEMRKFKSPINTGCKQIYQEKVSGVGRSRPEFQKMMQHIRQDDVLVIWRLDRLARSTKMLLEIVEQLQEKGASFKSMTEPWADTTSATGRLVMTFFAGIAEFERDLIRDRTDAGRKAALERGVAFGRPTKMSEEQMKLARKLLRQGKSIRYVAETFGVHFTTLYRYLREANV